MRVALKGIDIEKHLKASRAAYEMSGEMAGGPDENLQRNLDALVDVEKWACESHEICVGGYKNNGGGMNVEVTAGGSSGNDEMDAAAKALKQEAMGVGGGAAVASLREFVKAEVDTALKDLTMDFEIMESSMGGRT